MDINRDQVRNRLNKQRSRLRKRGASPSEISDYFGIPSTVPFGSLSNNDLKTILDRVNKLPTVTVIDGYIYPTRYISARKIWDSKGSRAPLVKGFKKALDTNFIKQDKTLDDTRRRFKDFERNFVNLYADQVENLGLKDIADEIRKSSYKKLKRFIDAGMGTTDFSVFGNTNDETRSADEMAQDTIQEQREATANQISTLWSQFSKRRMKPIG